jgi:hypothetical protein
MNIWFSYRATFKSFTVVQYECIKRNPNIEFRKLLGIISTEPIDESVFIEAIHDSSFEVMKEKERQGAIDSPKLQTPDANDNAYKVRKGKVGGYTELFTNLEDIRYARECLHRLDMNFGYQYDDWGV